MVIFGCKENIGISRLAAIDNQIVVATHAEAKISKRAHGRYCNHLGSRGIGKIVFVGDIGDVSGSSSKVVTLESLVGCSRLSLMSRVKIAPDCGEKSDSD